MSANELTQILEIGGAWEDDSGNLHNVPTGEFEQALSEAIAIIERTRIRETATEPPKKEDGGTGNHAPYVMARENKHDFWEEIELEWVANNPDEYPQWTCVPEFEGGEA